MAYQTAGNILVAIKRETTAGTAATAASATQMRIIDSPGMVLTRGVVQSNEKRDDALKSMGRLASKMVDGSYNAEITVGGATDMIIEALTRGTWATATSISFATMTTVAIGTNTVSAAGGSWFTQGVRVGDLFTISGTTVSADNGLNTRVLSMTTLTLVVATGTYTTLAASATGTLTILKKLTNPTTLVNYSHTIEQYDQDIDLSELFLGCSAIGMRLSFRPNQMATATFTFKGMDRTVLTTGTSPWFTTPSVTTGLALIADDSTIRYNGATVASFTSFDLDFQIAAKAPSVLGSFVTPGVFLNDLMVGATITGLRSDFANLTLFDAETEFEMSIKLEAPGSTPKDCLGFFFPRVKVSALSAPAGGGDGEKPETLGIMIGPKVAATGYDAGCYTVHSSAA